MWFQLTSILFLLQGFHATKSAKPHISVEELMKQIVQNESYEVNHTLTVEDLNSTEVNPLPLNLIRSFPPDFISEDFRHNGGFLIHLAIFGYLCFVMAIVIDSYFLQSLQYFCTALNIPPNISGSTFMALGTSSPEFFSSILSILLGESTIGTGAIVGSSMFNTLAIPGICGLIVFLLRIPMIKINYWPIGRDIIFYSITVILFILSIKDNSVDWLESVIFIFIYILYIFSLYIWSTFDKLKITRKASKYKHKFFHKYTKYLRRASLEQGENPSVEVNQKLREMANSITDTQCIRYALFPFIMLMKITIPKPTCGCFVVTFLMSSLWIAGLTYTIIWMVSLIGDTFNFPESISGMTILAVGNNIPELISSFILIRKFQLLDMAMCHIIGSNIFNILICLGLPWFFKILALTIRTGWNLEELQHYIIPLDKDMFPFVASCLALSLISFIIIFRLHHWQLTGSSGLISLIVYALFIVFTLFYQANLKL